MLRRVATRFTIAYFALYSVGTPIVSYLLRLPDGRSVGMHNAYRLVSWVGAHLFGAGPLDATPGSGDRLFDWIQMFTFALVAALVAAVWTTIDRGRSGDRGAAREVRLRGWLRTGLRFALGGVLMYYGVEKIYPTQMPAPDLVRLLQPVGALSPERLLWTWIGASLPYESLIGCLETAAAVMLFVPRLARLGAALAFFELLYVFVLDVAYDVPVRLFVFHLVVMAGILFAADAVRVVNVLLNRKAVAPVPEPALFASPRWMKVATAVQILFGAYVAGAGVIQAHALWADRDQANVSMGPIYGAWSVDVMTVDGQLQPPLVTQAGRWRRIVFEQGSAFFQRMDDTFLPYSASVDLARYVVTLGRDAEPGWSALAFQLQADGRLVLDGGMDGRAVHFELTKIDPKALPLVSHEFHISQESPNYDRHIR